MLRPHWLLLPASLALLVLAAACIERPASPRTRREKFDRSGLSDVLLTSLPPTTAPGAVFGEALQLVKVEVNPPAPSPGDRVEVSYYFRVLDEVDEDYKIFVHIDDRAGRESRINGDHWPSKGRYPTGAWRRGEVVRDAWTFTVPPGAAGAMLDVWTGFYQPGKDDRLAVTNRNEVRTDGNNRVLAVTVAVR